MRGWEPRSGCRETPTENSANRRNDMKRLEGKVAVVTGGNSGIGLAAAQRLQEEGAKVAILGRSRKTLDQAVKTIGNGVVAVQGDVAKLTDVDKFYAEVSQKLGKNRCFVRERGSGEVRTLCPDVGKHLRREFRYQHKRCVFYDSESPAVLK